MSIVLGLTGGIATGKSTVANFFKDAGIPVIDTDAIAKQALESSEAPYHQLVQTFGSDYLRIDGSINRKKLAYTLFHDADAQAKINAIVHPYVLDITRKEIARLRDAGEAIVVIDVPLLFESGYDQEMDETLVVYTTKAIQLDRLMARDAIDEAYAKKKIAAQWPLSKKKSAATHTINNSKSILETKEAFDRLLKSLKERA